MKTDRRDATKLARLYRARELTTITVPTPIAVSCRCSTTHVGLDVHAERIVIASLDCEGRREDGCAARRRSARLSTAALDYAAG